MTEKTEVLYLHIELSICPPHISHGLK